MAQKATLAGTGLTTVPYRISSRQSGRWAQQVGASQGVPAQSSVLAQLEQLGELKASGVLTEAEFAALKARVLAG